MELKIPRINNFDLIRFFAALQVVYGHSLTHLKIENYFVHLFYGFLKYFPGVPIFFTVSGFLIFWAYDRNPNIKKYALNRVLRLYPALYVCLFITIVLLVCNSTTNLLSHQNFYAWLIAQLTIFQFYTPEILRFWGVGTPNGSLWTIAVEVQYYILVPVIFLIMRKMKNWVVLLTLVTASILANFSLNLMPENIIQKLAFVSIVPYLFNFLIGSIFYIFWNKLGKLVQNNFIKWALAYAVFVLIFDVVFEFNLTSYHITNIFQPISMVILSCLVLSFAFSINTLSERFLKHNDISYGIYIYHMLVVNTLVTLGYIRDVKYLIFTFAITVILGYISWIFIEKPVLSLKKKF
ncbi:acyltransferase family protein [Acinetobacter indicus]|uniref:acyltransferase family protein n=1 Tax=Acinetobacter indicus TaxID=756892 RepID=UPI0012E2FEE4|nr:acyltransferase [Acinetobacter indicus]